VTAPPTLLSHVVHDSYLPGAYDAGLRIEELTQDWGAPIGISSLRLPTFVYQGLDYGNDQDAFACENSLNRCAGVELPQHLRSVVAFDANGLGSDAAEHALRNGHPGALYVLNSAAGNNVPEGTENNIREGLFGAKLKNGAIVVGTISDDLPSYFWDQVETMVELPLENRGRTTRRDDGLKEWKNISQARGVDVFQTMAIAFFHEASQAGWRGGKHTRITDLTRKDLHREPTRLLLDRSPRRFTGGVPRYILSSQPELWRSLAPNQSHVPVTPNDLRAAAYSAFRIANGGQPVRAFNDPKNVPAIHVLDLGFESLDRDTPVEIWAQVQNDGSLVVGRGLPEIWQCSPGERPVFRLHSGIAPRDLASQADRLFPERHNLSRHGVAVADHVIAMEDGPISGRVDDFGNYDVHQANVGPGQRVNLNGQADRHFGFPVRDTMFQAEPAYTMEDARDPRCAGFSKQASGGGWRVRVLGSDGRVYLRPLKTSQAYIRTATPEIASAASVLDLRRNANNTFPAPEAVRFAIEGVARATALATPGAA
jgi:hypothetical protein